MKKIRLYLDTTVISALDDHLKPERMKETYLLWKELKEGKYEIVISSVLAEELRKCEQEKRDVLFGFLDEIVFTDIESNETIEAIAKEIVRMGILKKRCFDDCLHIGSAIYSECDCIVSWNFRHLVNFKTVKGVRAVTGILNYKNIEIMSPTMVIGREK